MGTVALLDAAVLALGSLILGRNMFHFFTLLTLLESGSLFFTAGAIDIGGSLSFHKLMKHQTDTKTSWTVDRHRVAQSKAAPLLLAGIVLFVLSFVLAYPLN